MEDPNSKSHEEPKQINSVHPSGLNRAQRRKVGQLERNELKALQAVPVSEFVPFDTQGVEYAEGVTPPIHDPSWPWMLEEITQRRSDNKIITHKMTGMSTKAVSAIRISYAKPQDHLTFRRGKPLAIEFKDAVTTLKLTRQGRAEKKPVVVTNAEDAIDALKGEESEKPI